MKSNTKTILSIGLVLLVITIGISFSYFVSKTTENELEDANTEVPTAKIPEFKLETNVDTPASLPIYPGTKNYISASVKGIKTGGEAGDKTKYQIKYTITGSVSVTEAFTQGKVTYKLYKTTRSIANPITCKEVTGTQGENDKQTEVHYTQDCNLDSSLSSYVTLKTDTGKGSITEGTATFTYEDTIPADNTTTHYYYLVVEYPNENTDQSADMGKSITYSINSIISAETGIKGETSAAESPSQETFNELVSLNSQLQSNGKLGETGFTSIETGTSMNQVYESEDNDGTSYYYRGNVIDNYVKFGKTGTEKDTGDDIWWRIIRINGDGSIRMIYAGTRNSNSAPYQKSSATNITVDNNDEFFYSTKVGHFDLDNKYVGFQYTAGVRNGHTKDSYVKEILDAWFTGNLSDEFNNGENTLIDKNAGFCGDRSAYSGTNVNTRNDQEYGVGTKTTYYGSFIRNYPRGTSISTNNPAKPTYKCEDENDLFTYRGSAKGTRSLTYPVGLITADEAVYAGGLYNKNNSSYYLYNNSYYWTMSPYDFASEERIFVIGGNGELGNWCNGSGCGLRPVINLVSGSLISGDGTAYNPFKTTAA